MEIPQTSEIYFPKLNRANLIIFVFCFFFFVTLKRLEYWNVWKRDRIDSFSSVLPLRGEILNSRRNMEDLGGNGLLEHKEG